MESATVVTKTTSLDVTVVTNVGATVARRPFDALAAAAHVQSSDRELLPGRLPYVACPQAEPTYVETSTRCESRCCLYVATRRLGLSVTSDNGAQAGAQPFLPAAGSSPSVSVPVVPWSAGPRLP